MWIIFGRPHWLMRAYWLLLVLLWLRLPWWLFWRHRVQWRTCMRCSAPWKWSQLGLGSRLHLLLRVLWLKIIGGWPHLRLHCSRRYFRILWDLRFLLGFWRLRCHLLRWWGLRLRLRGLALCRSFRRWTQRDCLPRWWSRRRRRTPVCRWPIRG